MEFWTEKYEDELESIKRAALLSVSLSRFSVLLQMAKCRLSAALKRDKTPHKSRTTNSFFQLLAGAYSLSSSSDLNRAL